MRRIFLQVVHTRHGDLALVGPGTAEVSRASGGECTGLGIDELSMPPALVPQIKALLRREDHATLEKLADKALRQRDARAVRALRPAP